MDALTLKGFLRIAALAGVPVGVVVFLAFLLAGQEPLFSTLIGVVAMIGPGAIVAGIVYLARVMDDIQGLHLAAEELLPGEEVILESESSMVHYRRGRRGVFDSVGGRLVLTNKRLAFLAHRGQLYHYRLFLRLDEIEHLECWPDPGMWKGELRVVLDNGEKQLFTFGLIQPVEPQLWAEAISEFGLHARLPQNGLEA